MASACEGDGGAGGLCGKSVLRVGDLTEAQLRYLLALTGRLRAKKKQRASDGLLRGKNVALLFEKLSTRTRCAFSVAAKDEGAHVEYLNANDIHFGKKESIADTARVLGRMFDGILFRGYRHDTVEILATSAGVPVWNGLSDEEHPSQTLADLFTIQDCLGALEDLTIVYVGDGRNNVANSLMAGAATLGMRFVNCTPAELAPEPALLRAAERVAAGSGGSVTVEPDPKAAVCDANVVYTDVWVSMGEEALFDERIRLLRPYQVNAELMAATGRVGSGGLIFLHCLPAFHDTHTEVTRELGALEVTDEVFSAEYSKVFDQAENRLHTAKALMVATLTEDGSAQ